MPAFSFTDPDRKSADSPDVVRPFAGHGHADVVHIAGMEAMRATFEPGWRWSQDVKPIAGTDSCQASHLGYCLQGSLTTRMDDGSEFTMTAGDFAAIPPGHDAWVDGDEDCVFVDFGAGVQHYATTE